MSNSDKHIVIVGAGLVGSLLAIYLRKADYQVSVYERRSDPRQSQTDSGRSINLALSIRGILALEEVGLGEQINDLIIPMKGRMIHDRDGNQHLQPYGKEGQVINSVSRIGLNILLLNTAEDLGAEIHFDRTCTSVDLNATKIKYRDADHPGQVQPDHIIGADGAFSAVRSAMERTDRFQYQQYYIEHGYKELEMPAHQGDFALDPNALHIWPRNSFMLIALPNLDKSFTCTLFLPFEGDNSFESIQNVDDLSRFFEANFKDTLPLIPDLSDQYNQNPTSSLVTVRSYPWSYKDTLLIGDAAHAIVPFYGQGMNCGFEDCRLFNSTLHQNAHDWLSSIDQYQKERKKDADAISTLALNNFIEMRDKVVDPDFVLQKKIEAHMHSLYPDQWIPLYSMVTFQPEMSYSEAFERGQLQDDIMMEVVEQARNAEDWTQIDFAPFVQRASL